MHAERELEKRMGGNKVKKVEISSLHSQWRAGVWQGIAERAGRESVVRINYRHRHIALRRSVRQRPGERMTIKQRKHVRIKTSQSILIRRLICQKRCKIIFLVSIPNRTFCTRNNYVNFLMNRREFEKTGRNHINSPLERIINHYHVHTGSRRYGSLSVLAQFCETLLRSWFACLRTRIMKLLCDLCRLRNHRYRFDRKCQRCHAFSQGKLFISNSLHPIDILSPTADCHLYFHYYVSLT